MIGDRSRILAVALVAGFALAAAACAPRVYLVDRQTVLEIEAAGDWPELDRRFHAASRHAGPVTLETTADRNENRQLYRMTHSDAPEGNPLADGDGR